MTPESFGTIVKQLEDKKTEFFTYKPKNERNFKVILKNMHPSFETGEISSALLELGHEVTNIWNIKQRQTQKPLPMFVVEILQNPTNKDIYKITSLLHSRVSFEPPRPKRQIPQCANCQQYGHTKSYCRRYPKCIKCAGDHLSKDCSQKLPSKDVKCVLCAGNHPANYKGCSVYQDLKKQRPVQSKPTNPIINQENRAVTNKGNQNFTQKVSSYADMVRKNSQPLDAPASVQQSSTTDALLQEIRDMMSMMKQMMGQMSAMTNLLINLMPKPQQCP